MGECEFDEGGYFIINGTEKVLIAQEKMRCVYYPAWILKLFEAGKCHYSLSVMAYLKSSLYSSQNQIYVFKKHSSEKYSYIAEIRSAKEGVVGYRPVSQLYVKLVSNKMAGASKWKPGCIYVTMPYSREDIPLAVVFRALGILSDKEIIEVTISYCP